MKVTCTILLLSLLGIANVARADKDSLKVVFCKARQRYVTIDTAPHARAQQRVAAVLGAGDGSSAQGDVSATSERRPR